MYGGRCGGSFWPADLLSVPPPPSSPPSVGRHDIPTGEGGEPFGPLVAESVRPRQGRPVVCLERTLQLTTGSRVGTARGGNRTEEGRVCVRVGSKGGRLGRAYVYSGGKV
jgi:hypothetical protein